MALAIEATNHGNRYSLIDINYDIKVIVDLLVQKKPFEEHQGRGFGETSETKHADFFSNETAKIALGIPLKNYQIQARRNWAQHDVVRNRARDASEPDKKIEKLLDNDLDDVMECGNYVFAEDND